MHAMGRLRIAFADREITLDDSTGACRCEHYGTQGSICGIRSVRPVWTPRYMRKQPPNKPMHLTALRAAGDRRALWRTIVAFRTAKAAANPRRGRHGTIHECFTIFTAFSWKV